MRDLRTELIELVEVGYDYDATMNIGKGWEPYEGCRQNLIMILEDPDTEVKIADDDPILYDYGKRRYHITLPVWWRPGVIALCFDENELDIGDDPQKMKESIVALTDPLNNSINEKCAAIKKAFLLQVNDDVAKNYYVTGMQGGVKGITLDRNLVEWECEL